MLSRRIDEKVYQSDFEYASSNYRNFNVIVSVAIEHNYPWNTLYKKWGLRGRKASPLLGAGMDSPLIESFKYFFAKTSFSDANDAPPQLD
jgi:hypothetical protein